MSGETRAVALRYLTDPTVTLPDLERIFGLPRARVLSCLAKELVPVRIDRWEAGWCQADVDLVRRMAAAGWSEYRVAARFDVTSRELLAALRALNVDLSALWPHRGRGHQKPRKPSPRRVAAVARYRAGETDLAAIARECGASYSSVRQWLLDAGIKPELHRRGRRQHPARAAVVERFKAGGVDARWLAAEFEVSRTSVQNWLRAEGLLS